MSNLTSPVDFPAALRAIWDHATDRYHQGLRDSAAFFSPVQLEFLASIGHSAQEVYDFVDDSIRYGEPDFNTFLLIAAQRRWYFLYVMQGQPGNRIVDTADLPPKSNAIHGTPWLPRLIEKARAKLRGEMSPDLMFCCAGDRSFFREHGLHPADLLEFVAHHFDDTDAIATWVLKQSRSASQLQQA